MSRSVLIEVTEASHVGAARRQAAMLTDVLGLSDTEQGNVAIVVTEAANNLVKHARGGGSILLRHFPEQGMNGLEILSIDSGPGMVDVAKCLEDGYSTSGSPGTGLGAIQRLSSTMDIYSQPEKGTVIVAQLGPKRGFRSRSPLSVGAVCVPMKGETACGDAWAAVVGSLESRILLVDGLGHGVLAARAADEAVKTFLEFPNGSPVDLVKTEHDALRPTRGASLAVAHIDFSTGQVRYVGVGNISATILHNQKSRRLVSHNGTVGHEMRSLQEFTYEWSAGSILIMHSDGLLTRWSLDPYPGLVVRHPSLIAAVLYRDYRRGRDDASVLVLRQEAGV